MTDSADKRSRKRVLYRFESRIEADGYPDIFPEIHDISMSGVFFKSQQLLAVGTRGRLTIRLQCGERREQVNSGFRVQRVVEQSSENQPRGFAVLYEDIDTDSSITLFNIIKYQSGEVAG